MKNELQLVTSLHQATKRDYLGRMNDSKVEAMVIAKKYDAEYWDGDRRFGYGGYKYMPGRWAGVAQKLIGTLHNLHIFELEVAVAEIERVGKHGYIMVESFRNELEMFNLECWALTAKSLMDVDEWKWAYSRFGYTGDFEFIYFE